MDADRRDALACFPAISRRTLLKGTAALSAATAFLPLVAGRAAAQGTTLTVWGGVSSSEAGDALLGQQMQEWGAENGFEVEYVTWPLPDYATQLTTAVEAGEAPDVVMMLQGVSSQSTITLFYAEQGRLVDLTGVYNELKDLGGGMYETLLPWVESEGVIYSIPMQSDVSVMYARLDLIEEVTGERVAPATLDELEQLATEINSPPQVYAIGLTVGRTPDAHAQIAQMILNEGGTLVDESGAPAIDNPGTIAALERMKRWWDNGLIPENSASWDDSGNNTAYNAGQAAFVFNPPSIFAYLEANDPELLAETTQAPFPAGPAGNFPSVGTWSWSIFEGSPNVDAAKQMITAIMQPEQLQAVYEEVGGRWYPVYRDLAEAPFWQERPFFNDFPEIIENARPIWHPAEASPLLLSQLSAVYQTLVLPDMLQQVLINDMAPADAAADAQTRMEQAFEEAAGGQASATPTA
ncbi:MAG TPA: substrate-binding domain-containing protein [Thermomicrobiales bacterium]|nr:substrate-binding domain-containing protein [Thermomicrobiales bacterium]